MSDGTVPLPGERVLEYTEIGAPDGQPVIYCHGAPGSRIDLAWLGPQLPERVRLIGVDRPGYGGSTMQPGRDRNDWADDVRALADHLGIEQFAVLGLSSGGPYAAMLAALVPERVVGAAIVAGVSDMSWSGAWDGLGADHAALMRIGDENAAVAWCEERYRADGSKYFDHGGDLAPADAAVLEDMTLVAGLFPTFTEAFRHGIAGYARDITVEATAWSFDPAAIVAPTLVFHGEADTIVPVAHGRHTAEQIPGARLTTFPDLAHLSMLTQIPAICAELVGALSI